MSKVNSPIQEFTKILVEFHTENFLKICRDREKQFVGDFSVVIEPIITEILEKRFESGGRFIFTKEDEKELGSKFAASLVEFWDKKYPKRDWAKLQKSLEEKLKSLKETTESDIGSGNIKDEPAAAAPSAEKNNQTQ
jgi:hypothetical protein